MVSNSFCVFSTMSFSSVKKEPVSSLTYFQPPTIASFTSTEVFKNKAYVMTLGEASETLGTNKMRDLAILVRKSSKSMKSRESIVPCKCSGASLPTIRIFRSGMASSNLSKHFTAKGQFLVPSCHVKLLPALYIMSYSLISIDSFLGKNPSVASHCRSDSEKLMYGTLFPRYLTGSFTQWSHPAKVSIMAYISLSSSCILVSSDHSHASIRG